MAKQAGLGDRLYISGYDLSGDIGSIQRVAGGPAAMDLTGIDKSAYERVGGLRDGGIDFTAWFNKAASAAHLRLGALPTTDVVVTYARGLGLGSPVACCVAKQLDYAGTRAADGGLSFATSSVANGYGVEWGQQLTAGLRTDTGATASGTGLDGAASTAFGAQFYVQITAFTGTSVTVKIQDSADNVSFADLSGASFAAATGPTAERIAVSGTVRRYLRVATTGTFTGASFLVSGVRNTTETVF